MFEALENKIKEICDTHNVETDEDFINLMYNKDGTERAEFWEQLREFIKNEHSKIKSHYVPVDLNDFSKLSDAEIYDEMSSLVFAVEDLNEIQQTALVAYEFEMEFANGGAEQYFLNTRGEHLDELCECLKKIGADKYAEKCFMFINKYNVTSSDFAENDNGIDYKKIKSMYPYEELENAILKFYYDDPLSKYIVDFVRSNEDDFKIEE